MKKLFKGCLVFLVVICVLGVVGSLLTSKLGSTSKTSSSSSYNESLKITHSYTISKEQVKKKLKSPSSAKFPKNPTNYVTKINDSTYRVKAYVDSENGFGAMLRSDYTIDIVYRGKKAVRFENFDLKKN